MNGRCEIFSRRYSPAVYLLPHDAPSGLSNPQYYLVFIETGDVSSVIQNAMCERNSSTNQLMSIRLLRSTCEAWGYAVLGKVQLSGTSASQNALYLAARANHRFSQIQQGVLWHLFSVDSTARTYHPWFCNSKSLASGTSPVPQLPQSLLQLSRCFGWSYNMRSLRIQPRISCSYGLALSATVKWPCKCHMQALILLAQGDVAVFPTWWPISTC